MTVIEAGGNIMGTTAQETTTDQPVGNIYVTDNKGRRSWGTGTPQEAINMNKLAKAGEDAARYSWFKVNLA
jgi:hypothetical protein